MVHHDKNKTCFVWIWCINRHTYFWIDDICGDTWMSSDRLVNFLHLYNNWTQGVFAKGIMISFMVIISIIILVIFLADDTEENRTILETTISLLINIMLFVAGIGIGVIVIVPMLMSRLQEKV